MIPKGFMLFPSERPEGKDVCACIWLSINPKLIPGSTPVPLDQVLYLPGKFNATPMVFMHGSGDEAGKKIAKKLEKDVKDPKAPKEMFKFTGASEIPGSKATGAELLKTEGTDKQITDWLEEVVLSKGREWEARDWQKSQFYWISAGKGRTPARVLDPASGRWNPEMTMMFETFQQFMRK